MGINNNSSILYNIHNSSNRVSIMRLDELKKFDAERKAKMHDPVENPLHYIR